MEQKLALGKYGAQLWTRERAREIRDHLEELLESLDVGGVAVVDAAGVEVFDFSFANELFGRALLSLPHEHPGRFLVVENLSPYVRENLTQALESLGLLVIERSEDQLTLIGKVHPADQETFAAIATSPVPATATVLRDKLGMNLNAVNERLSKLSGLGVVRRERGLSPAGREQYRYHALA